MELIILFIISALIMFLVWKTSVWSAALAGIASPLKRVVGWVSDERGTYASLPEQLEYRDFYAYTTETADGWLWAALEVTPVSTDGISNRHLNELGRELNYVFAGVPEGTQVQVINSVEMSVGRAAAVMDDLTGRTEDEVWCKVMKARTDFLRAEADAKRLRSVRTYIFIGRQGARKIKERVSIKGFFSPSPWVDLERDEVRRLRDDVLRTRETVASYYRAAGGGVRIVSPEETRTLAFKCLNRERSQILSAPEYEYDMNPREGLCFTDVDVAGLVLKWADGTLTQTVSMCRQPKKMNAVTLERLTRNEMLDFSFEHVMHFTLGNWVKWDENLERQEKAIAESQDNASVINRTERIKGEQIESVRNELLTSDEKIGIVGLSITVSANDADELRRRVDLIHVAMRACRGMEGIQNRKGAALVQFVTTLPCSPHKDLHVHPCMTRDAMAYAALTGPPVGVPLKYANNFYLTADNRLFPWNTASPEFKSGMTAMVGGSGSGKSVLLNYQRSSFLAEGRRGVTFDYGGSCFRMTRAAGGEMIDITDPRHARGLGLFAIRPRADEHYSSDELTTEEKLPLDRLSALEEMMETLCLDPRKPEDGLHPSLVKALHKIIRLTYTRTFGRTPKMDDFIETALLLKSDERELGNEIAARLGIYASGSSVGRFLNDDSEPV